MEAKYNPRTTAILDPPTADTVSWTLMSRKLDGTLNWLTPFASNLDAVIDPAPADWPIFGHPAVNYESNRSVYDLCGEFCISTRLPPQQEEDVFWKSGRVSKFNPSTGELTHFDDSPVFEGPFDGLPTLAPGYSPQLYPRASGGVYVIWQGSLYGYLLAFDSTCNHVATINLGQYFGVRYDWGAKRFMAVNGYQSSTFLPLNDDLTETGESYTSGGTVQLFYGAYRGTTAYTAGRLVDESGEWMAYRTASLDGGFVYDTPWIPIAPWPQPGRNASQMFFDNHSLNICVFFGGEDFGIFGTNLADRHAYVYSFEGLEWSKAIPTRYYDTSRWFVTSVGFGTIAAGDMTPLGFLSSGELVVATSYYTNQNYTSGIHAGSVLLVSEDDIVLCRFDPTSVNGAVPKDVVGGVKGTIWTVDVKGSTSGLVMSGSAGWRTDTRWNTQKWLDLQD